VTEAEPDGRAAAAILPEHAGLGPEDAGHPAVELLLEDVDREIPHDLARSVLQEEDPRVLGLRVDDVLSERFERDAVEYRRVHRVESLGERTPRDVVQLLRIDLLRARDPRHPRLLPSCADG
jgi:hypothetical protein